MKENRLVLDGRHIEAAWWGPPPDRAPTLVLLHEGLGSVGLWRDFPARLAAATGAGVFAWSRFGYGRSAPIARPRPLDYMQREARDVLPRVLDLAGIRRGVLVGHSDGGSIAAIAAGTRDDPRLRGLALIAPHFFVEPLSISSIVAIRRAYETGGLRARLARHHDDVDGAFYGWADAWLDPGFPAAFELTAELRGIALPTLVVQGAQDPYGTDAHARRAEREIPGGSRTVMLDAGHAPHEEAPEATLAAIAAFARELLQEPQDAD
ncbi:MAG: alpha/beta fold hydrolase [Rhodospirillales bacterium]|nr:alpha/beta fold hydrolase [Rhodospirillales bacterium]